MNRLSLPLVVLLALAALLVAVAGLVLQRLVRPAPSPLPPYVEILVDDRQLVAELELANACERIGRVEGRLVVVECAVPHPTGPRSSLDGRSPMEVAESTRRLAFAFATAMDR